MHRLVHALAPLALLGPVPFAPVEASDALAAPADVALVTAIDMSDSIMRHHEWLQFEGIARAVLDPGFLAAVANGQRGRITFTVFTWSSQGRFRLVVPWMLIDGPGTALAVATLIRAAPRPVRFGGDERAGPDLRAERRTDLSATIRFGASLLVGQPGPSRRQVLNLIGNGVDNVAPGPDLARDSALATGLTINGVVLGDDPALATYFRTRVTGGYGSFVMRVTEPRAFADVMRAKFLFDLIAGSTPFPDGTRAPS